MTAREPISFKVHVLPTATSVFKNFTMIIRAESVQEALETGQEILEEAFKHPEQFEISAISRSVSPREE